jgi:hypothetical protein
VRAVVTRVLVVEVEDIVELDRVRVPERPGRVRGDTLGRVDRESLPVDEVGRDRDAEPLLGVLLRSASAVVQPDEERPARDHAGESRLVAVPPLAHSKSLAEPVEPSPSGLTASDVGAGPAAVGNVLAYR